MGKYFSNNLEPAWRNYCIPLIFIVSFFGGGGRELHLSAQEAKVNKKVNLEKILDLAKLGFDHQKDKQITNELIIARMRESRRKTKPQHFFAYNKKSGEVERAEKIMKDGHKILNFAPFKIVPPINWGSNPLMDKVWHIRINEMQPIDSLLRAYLKTKNSKYINAARGVILDWIDYNITKNLPNPVKWEDMPLGIRADKLAFFIDHDLRADDVDVETLCTMIMAAKKHADRLKIPERFSYSNHGIFMMMGLASICHALPELVDYDSYRTYSRSRMRYLLREQFSDEGIHREHSPFYHLFVCRTFLTIKDLGYFEGDVNFGSMLEMACSNLIWMYHPNGDIVLIGDTEPTPLMPYRNFHSYIQYVLSNGTDGTGPSDNIAIFPKSGYACFRSPWSEKPFGEHSFLFFSAAYHSNVHKHSDDFTFEWSELGMPIIVDSGKYTYTKNQLRKFFQSTRSSNTIEIDGSDYPRDGKAAFKSAIRNWGFNDGIFFVEAEIHRTNPIINHKRVIVMKMKQWLCVIDVLNAKEEHIYKQWFGFHENINVVKKSNYFELRLPHTPKKIYAYELINDPKKIELVKGCQSPNLQGWISRRYNELQARYSGCFSKKGRNIFFAALFSIDSRIKNANVSIAKDQSIHVAWTNTGNFQIQRFTYTRQGNKSNVTGK